ncbi:MAG: ABC transporter substrate-binding protein [Clostridiales bacterium]|nr:ABC transporter substrate-binding protein [Clostridiales bacterium]
MKKKILAMTLIAVCATALWGCSNTDTGSDSTSAAAASEAETDETASDGTVKMTVGAVVEQTSLDPAQISDFGSYQVTAQICDQILGVDKDGNVVDGLVSCETEDYMTYTLKVKEGVLFSDGTELTAEDVAFSIEHLMDLETASSYAALFASVESVEATDTYEVTITLSQPDTAFEISLTYCYVFSKAAYEEAGDAFGSAEGGVIGTGAYQLEAWDQGVSTTLVKNEYYDGIDNVDIDEVEVMYFSDTSSLLLALKSGQVDFWIEPDSGMNGDISALDNVTLNMVEDRTTATQLVCFNTETGPFSDVNVRKAVSAMLDTSVMMESQYGEGYYTEAANLLVSPGSYGYAEDGLAELAAETTGYEYDVEAAQEYLAQSDYPDGFSCNVMCWGDSASYNMCIAIQDALKALNIEVEVVQQTAEEAVAASYGFSTDENGYRTYDMFVCLWSSSYNEPLDFYEPLVATSSCGMGGCNIACYSNTAVDELLAAAKMEADESVKAEEVTEMCSLVMDDAPYLIVGYKNVTLALNNRFVYEDFSASWVSNLSYAEIELAE